MLKNYKKSLATNLITKSFLALLLFSFYNCFGQETINGKIISEIDNYEEIQVFNSTRNTFTKINIDGVFKIMAFINDTIQINSHSYANYSFIVTEKHLEKTTQISLKDNIEDLKEIIIDSNIINEEELAEINEQLQSQIKNDIKKNPYLYTKPVSGFNIFGVFKLAYSLLRKKTSEDELTVLEVFINHQDLTNYFKEDPSFLVDELSIPENQIAYFFLFIEDEQISAELLTKANEFYFMEELTLLNDEFFKKQKQ